MAEQRHGETQAGEMHRKTALSPEAKDDPGIVWSEKPRKLPGEELMKNLGVTAALVLCAVCLKSGAVPSANSATDAVLAAVSGDTLLDDQLGKLSFVSTLFPEATLVFGESDGEQLTMPVSGGVLVHAWSREEPYTSWTSSTGEVFSVLDGEVLGVYHGEGEEVLVQILRNDGVSCLYGNLSEACVNTGDAVSIGQKLGVLAVGTDCAFEVRKDGYSIDPTSLMGSAS